MQMVVEFGFLRRVQGWWVFWVGLFVLVVVSIRRNRDDTKPRSFVVPYRRRPGVWYGVSFGCFVVLASFREVERRDPRDVKF